MKEKLIIDANRKIEEINKKLKNVSSLVIIKDVQQQYYDIQIDQSRWLDDRKASLITNIQNTLNQWKELETAMLVEEMNSVCSALTLSLQETEQ
jgi:hypothetical protein